jgi:acetyl-CoA acetyltransferase
VLLRRHASLHPGAHFQQPVTVAEVMASRPIASPLKLLDCCPVSDGGAACVVSRSPRPNGVRIRGCAQTHRFQHISAAPTLSEFGGGACVQRALANATVNPPDIAYLAFYDSFTITLAILLEETGFAPIGQAAARVREGVFNHDGSLPLNTHGGLIGYGHSGVAGGMAHLVEAHRQMTSRAGQRQVRDAPLALVHADGGVLSSHVSLVLERR